MLRNALTIALMFFIGNCAVACRFSFDKQRVHGGFGPRGSAEVKVMVWASDDALATTVALAAESNASIDKVQVAGAALRDSKLSPYPEAHCALARDAGANYLLHASTDVSYHQTYVCTQYRGILKSLVSQDREECVEGHYANQHTTYSFTLALLDTAACRKAPGILFEQVVSGPEEFSRPEAEELLSQAVPAKVREFSFPWQANVQHRGPPARAQIPATSDETNAGDILASFRGDDYLGLSRVKSVSPGELRVEPLSCCFDLEVNDALQQRGLYHLVDIGVGVSATRLTGADDALLVGPGWHLRGYALTGGLVLGLSGDLLVHDESSVILNNLEIGWLWKLFPGLDAAAMLAGGFGAYGTEGRETQIGAHASAFAALTYNPLPWLYLQLEGGYLYSSDYVDQGPRAERFIRAPIARFNLGLELH